MENNRIERNNEIKTTANSGSYVKQLKFSTTFNLGDM